MEFFSGIIYPRVKHAVGIQTNAYTLHVTNLKQAVKQAVQLCVDQLIIRTGNVFFEAEACRLGFGLKTFFLLKNLRQRILLHTYVECYLHLKLFDMNRTHYHQIYN